MQPYLTKTFSFLYFVFLFVLLSMFVFKGLYGELKDIVAILLTWPHLISFSEMCGLLILNEFLYKDFQQTISSYM